MPLHPFTGDNNTLIHKSDFKPGIPQCHILGLNLLHFGNLAKGHNSGYILKGSPIASDVIDIGYAVVGSSSRPDVVAKNGHAFFQCGIYGFVKARIYRIVCAKRKHGKLLTGV
jgi:hypothetical protein